jgi:hypothetical protein
MSSLRWQTVEALGLAFYIEKGCRVLTPLIDNKDYDFAIDEDGEIKTVNVKKAYWDRGWAISKTGSPNGNGPVDIYLAFLPVQQVFIELHGSFFEGVKSRARKIPVKIIEDICNLPNQKSCSSSPIKVSRRTPMQPKRN